MASVIISAMTRQFMLEWKTESSYQLRKSCAIKAIHARLQCDVVVWRVELTLVAGMIGGSGLGLGCCGFGRHFEELVDLY
jgi:hypothetical protein